MSAPPTPSTSAIGAPGGAAAAAEAARAGFRCVKVKVGVGDDAGRIAAVRAAGGPELALRVDANGAWATATEALANLRALAPAGIEYAEEPVHGAEALGAVRAAGVVAVAMDETAEPGAGVTDAVCLKISRSGGITALLADARLARAAGSVAYVASAFDGPAGIAAGVHAAAALAVGGPLPWCGLATLGAFAAPMPPALAPVRGAIAVPPGPGLGVNGGH